MPDLKIMGVIATTKQKHKNVQQQDLAGCHRPDYSFADLKLMNSVWRSGRCCYAGMCAKQISVPSGSPLNSGTTHEIAEVQ